MDNPTYYPYSLREFDTSSSDTYAEMTPPRQSRQVNQYLNDNGTDNNYLINTERITYVKELLRLQQNLNSVKKSSMYLGVFILLLFLIGFIAGYLIVIQSYNSLSRRVEEEDQQIYNNLKELYKKCKENPMDFDWTAAIYDKLDEITKKIPKDTAELINELFQQLIAYLVQYSEDQGVGDTNQENTFHFKITKGEDIEISLHPHHFNNNREKRRPNRIPRGPPKKEPYHPFPTGIPDPRYTPKTTQSVWYGPPGNPGDQ